MEVYILEEKDEWEGNSIRVFKTKEGAKKIFDSIVKEYESFHKVEVETNTTLEGESFEDYEGYGVTYKKYEVNE